MAQSLSHPEERTPHPQDDADPDRHVPGSMDISVQEATFEGFMRVATRGAVVIVLILVFLALVSG